MQDPISTWISRIDEVTAAVKAEFGALTVQQLNQKPNPKAWSIAQNLDHLIVINQTYVPLINSVRDGSFKMPFSGKLGFMVNMLGKMVLASVLPDRKRKIKTFAIWQPSQSEISGDIVSRFEQHQESLKALIRSTADLVAKGQVIHSPASRMVVYKLSTAWDIVTIHEQRHLEQAREVKKTLS